jgi:hypothetical protein
MTDAARDSGTVIALPFGMPHRLDTGYIRDLAEAVDQAGYSWVALAVLLHQISA